MNKINKIENLTCHCKEVQIELKLNNGLEEVVRCNCSLCKKRGSIMAKIKINNLKIIKGFDKLKLYNFYIVVEILIYLLVFYRVLQ